MSLYAGFYNHQKEIVDDGLKKVGIFQGTGSGKTRVTTYLAKGVTLVVCPKTQAEDDTWTGEWKFQQKNPDDLLLISKEQFKIRLKKDGIKGIATHIDTLIIDEAHTVAGVQAETYQKNYKKYPKSSDLYKALHFYIKTVKPERVYILTATPDPTPMNVYALGKLLGKEWNYWKFRECFYFQKDIRGRMTWLANRSNANKELLAKTINSIGYTGKLNDWFDVPDQIFKTERVGITAEQKRRFTDLKILYPDPLVQLGKRLRLEQGIFEDEFVKENKTEAIAKYANEFKQIIVFARYRAQIELYEKKLTKKGYKVLTMTGITKKRGDVIAEAKSSEECIFIVQSSISAGWQLKEYPCMIFASLSFSYVDYVQGMGRIQRSDNIKKNTYIFLEAGETDEHVHKIIDGKYVFSEEKYKNKYAKQLCKKKKL